MLPSGYTAASVSDLIADINAANLAGGSNTITLIAATTFQLNAVNNSTDGATGLPIVAANDNLTIVGNADTIERSTASGTPAFRLLDVAGGASLTLQNLKLQGGLAFGSGVSAEGGAIYTQGTLTLNSVTVQNNIAQGSNTYGQAAAGGGIYSSGTLTLEGGTKVQNNQALGGHGLNGRPGRGTNAGNPGYPGGNGLGGGLYVAGGTATLSSVTLSANTAQGGQGGAGGFGYYDGGNGGTGGNGFGGGLYVAGGIVSLSSVTLSANTAQGGQGGAGGFGHINVGRGGAGGNGFGGGLYAGGGAVTLHSDTVQNNSAKGGAHGTGFGNAVGLGEGGGLYINALATLYLDAFTLADTINNTASTSNNDIFGSYTLIP